VRLKWGVPRFGRTNGAAEPLIRTGASAESGEPCERRARLIASENSGKEVPMKRLLLSISIAVVFAGLGHEALGRGTPTPTTTATATPATATPIGGGGAGRTGANIATISNISLAVSALALAIVGPVLGRSLSGKT
jgi:hypothetical protein